MSNARKWIFRSNAHSSYQAMRRANPGSGGMAPSYAASSRTRAAAKSGILPGLRSARRRSCVSSVPKSSAGSPRVQLSKSSSTMRPSFQRIWAAPRSPCRKRRVAGVAGSWFSSVPRVFRSTGAWLGKRTVSSETLRRNRRTTSAGGVVASVRTSLRCSVASARPIAASTAPSCFPSAAITDSPGS